MATVRMKKGDLYADIYDSPATIEQARKDGYRLVEEPKPVKTETKAVTEEVTVEPVHKKGKKPV